MTIYLTQHDKVGCLTLFFPLLLIPRTDTLERNDNTQMLTWDVIESYAAVCKQRIRHLHGIVGLQGPRTTPCYEHAPRTEDCADFLNVAPV
jgi:hypothetical protein